MDRKYLVMYKEDRGFSLWVSHESGRNPMSKLIASSAAEECIKRKGISACYIVEISKIARLTAPLEFSDYIEGD